MRENTWAVEGFFHICKRRERLGMFVTMEKDSEESGKQGERLKIERKGEINDIAVKNMEEMRRGWI